MQVEKCIILLMERGSIQNIFHLLLVAHSTRCDLRSALYIWATVLTFKRNVQVESKLLLKTVFPLSICSWEVVFLYHKIVYRWSSGCDRNYEINLNEMLKWSGSDLRSHDFHGAEK